ncbi:MAG: MarR family transcriptional regulator [Kangiellaceae bacterium]|nr:MarR family transcriptional regulator [Kangiellaceae bacterium]
MEIVSDVLSAVRRIIRAVDLNSKRLYKECGLTAPQLLLLSMIDKHPNQTIKNLSDDMSLSQGTVTIILDKLQSKSLIVRQRSSLDKRKTHIQLTEQGATLLALAPSPLQDSFLDNFSELEDWEQSQILSSLQKLAALMDAKAIDAAPVLEVGTLKKK